MIFDELSLPRDTGASDKQDSARLAGVMTVFEWPQPIQIGQYLSVKTVYSTANETRNVTEKKYVRHPLERIYDFSRDQALCLMAGLKKAGLSILVDKKYVDGKDLFSPSHMGHVRICQGLKPRWYQNAWLWFDVIYSAKVKPLAEPNQLLCMLLVHPDTKYIKFWLKQNKKWEQAIRDYWSGWRGEKELADHMIDYLIERHT